MESVITTYNFINMDFAVNVKSLLNVINPGKHIAFHSTFKVRCAKSSFNSF